MKIVLVNYHYEENRKNGFLPECELAQVSAAYPTVRIITRWHECNAREAPSPVNYQASGRKRGDYA